MRRLGAILEVVKKDHLLGGVPRRSHNLVNEPNILK